MSSVADRITTSRRFTKVRRLRTALFAFEGVLVLALMAYLIGADGATLTPFYLPLGRALSLMLAMVLVLTIENCLFRALAIRYAYKDAHKFLIADGGMKGSLKTMVLGILLAILLLLPMAQDASRTLLSKNGSETIGPVQTFRLQFASTDFLGITHARTITLSVESGYLWVTLYRNGIAYGNPSLLRPGNSLTWQLPVGGYSVYNATLENRDTGFSVYFSYDVKVGLPDNFATFVAYLSILLAGINGAWYAYLRPIRRRYATSSIYSADFDDSAKEEQDPWLPPRRPEERPWYEQEAQYGPATAPWPAPTARRHPVRSEGGRNQAVLEIPPPPTEDNEAAAPPPPPPPDLVIDAREIVITPEPGGAPTAPAPPPPTAAKPAKVDEGGDTVESLVERGEEVMVAGDLPSALGFFDRALSKDPNNMPALLHRAEIQRANGKDQEALDSLQGILTQDPRHHKALLARAQILAGQDRWEEALESYDRIAKGKPEYLEALKCKADVLVKLGETDLAVACLEEATRLAPSDASALGKLRALKPPVPRAAPAAAPEVTGDRKTVQELQGKGIGYMHVGMYTEALGSFNAILAKEPKNGFALLSKARVLERLGRQDEALDTYRSALATDPRDLNAMSALADLLLRMGRDVEARTFLEQAATVDPKGGDADERVKKYKEARSKLEEFLARLVKDQGVAENLTKAIADGYASLRTLEAATLQELMSIKGMDVSTARKILDEARRSNHP